jgi:hypothetical protein
MQEPGCRSAQTGAATPCFSAGSAGRGLLIPRSQGSLAIPLLFVVVRSLHSGPESRPDEAARLGYGLGEVGMDLTALLPWSWTLSVGLSVRVSEVILAGTRLPSSGSLRLSGTSNLRRVRDGG